MNVCIVGCGNIGSKRAEVVRRSQHGKVVAIVESLRDRWAQLQSTYDCCVSDDLADVVRSQPIDAVIVATPPETHFALVRCALDAGKHVLCEKPLATTAAESSELVRCAAERRCVLKSGFNLRHDAGLERAAALVQHGAIGRPYFFKAHYVNGCTLVNTNGVGGLADMGSHLIDLVRWFLGAPTDWRGSLQRYEFAAPADDNGFVGGNAAGVPFQLHCSLVRWRNAFGLEISGEQGTIVVSNLPKWGMQEVSIQRRVYPSGAPETTVETFEGDTSWTREWDVFTERVRTRDVAHNADGHAVMCDIEAIRRAVPLVDFRRGT